MGLYKWLDNNLLTFDSTSFWWCRQGMPGFAYYYQYNEPSRHFYTNMGEGCLVSRRGTTSTGVLCLDDVFCDAQYPFICERCM